MVSTSPRAVSWPHRIGAALAAALLAVFASLGASPAAARPPAAFLHARRRMAGKMRAVAGLVVSASALVGIAGFEAYRGTAYKDSANVSTIGYGATAGVKMGDTITPERALVRLHGEVSEHAIAIQRCIKAPLYQHEFDAYLTLAFNIGASAFCRTAGPGQLPTLLDLINTQRYAEACERILQFDKYRNPKTGQLEPLRGLTNRRQAERRICVGEQ